MNNLYENKYSNSKSDIFIDFLNSLISHLDSIKKKEKIKDFIKNDSSRLEPYIFFEIVSFCDEYSNKTHKFNYQYNSEKLQQMKLWYEESPLVAHFKKYDNLTMDLLTPYFEETNTSKSNQNITIPTSLRTNNKNPHVDNETNFNENDQNNKIQNIFDDLLKQFDDDDETKELIKAIRIFNSGPQSEKDIEELLQQFPHLQFQIKKNIKNIKILNSSSPSHEKRLLSILNSIKSENKNDHSPSPIPHPSRPMM